MLKKLFYIGLGIAIIAVKKSADFLIERKEKIADSETAESVAAAMEDVVANAQEAAEEAVEALNELTDAPEADDLTAIKGIGKTYANRLADAGITTYSALAGMSEEELREVTKATSGSADPQSWIAQAGSLS